MLAKSPLDSTIVSYLKADGLLREGHFAYCSGLHGTIVLDRDRLLADPFAASRMGYALAKAFFTAKIDTVAAPSIWGAALAQWVAYFLEPRARIVYATPMPDGSRAIAPNLHDLIAGRRVLLIDNLILSGATMVRFDAQVTELGGQVQGVGCLWSVSNTELLAHDVIGLLNDGYPAYLPGECPMCETGDDEPEAIPY